MRGQHTGACDDRIGSSIVRYEILKAFPVINQGEASSLSSRKMEIVLASLLIRADQVVTMDQLIAEIWGDRPPPRAVGGLHVYVSRLRKFLIDGEPDGKSSSPIVTRSPGYILRTHPDDLDLHVFRRRVNEGQAHAQASRREQAAASFQSALALCGPEVLTDLRAGPIIGGFTTWVNEVRLQCVEMLIECELALGRARDLVPQLYDLIFQHPLRESLYYQLMLSLYQAKRQADALKVYQLARQTLHRELGLEPAHQLRKLQHAILTAAAESTRPRRFPSMPGPAWPSITA
jgi:SARP family transcriptional regulator, regulator of embCAB operon